MSTNKIIEILGDQSDFLLNHTCKTIDKSLLHIRAHSGIWQCFSLRQSPLKLLSFHFLEERIFLSKCYHFPIPQQEVDNSQNIEQNAGW